MKQRWTWLACGLAAMVAFSACAWAGEGVPQDLQPPRFFLRPIHDTLVIVLILLVSGVAGLGSMALMLLAAARSPGRVAQAEQALRRGQWAAVIVGVLSVVVLALVSAVLGRALRAGAPGLAGLLVLVILGFLLWLGAFGLAATARIVGERLSKDPDQEPWRLVSIGGLAIGGSLLVPIFGWLVFLYLFCRGVGAAAISLFATQGKDAPGV